MTKIGPNKPCPCESGKKYKKCCRSKDEEKAKIAKMKKDIDVKRITREDLMFGPFTNCPNCKSQNTYGMFPLSSSKGYSKECTKCGHTQSYPLPKLKKKLVYLDQFVISNIAKLLDPSHKSHQEIKKDPFWESLFIKLEKLQDANLIICPDTFYHRDESIAGEIPFYLMERLYEHFSESKTLIPHLVVYRYQIKQHFEKWIRGEAPFQWEFEPRTIAWEDFNEWSFGIKVSVRSGPRRGERERLLKTNDEIKDGLVTLWTDWTNEQPATYKERVERELLGFKKLLFSSAQKHKQNQVDVIERAVRGEDVTEELVEKIMAPLTNDILEDLIHTAQRYCTTLEEVTAKIDEYLSNPKVLIQIPSLKISSLMYAGLAHRANRSGQKRVPKSLNDVHFISAYLPYCDAMFIDTECATILKEVPRDLPEEYKMEYGTKIFSPANREEFLAYLDDIYNSASADHMQAVKELGGDNHQPYWEILIREKAEKELEAEEEAEKQDKPKTKHFDIRIMRFKFKSII